MEGERRWGPQRPEGGARVPDARAPHLPGARLPKRVPEKGGGGGEGAAAGGVGAEERRPPPRAV